MQFPFYDIAEQFLSGLNPKRSSALSRYLFLVFACARLDIMLSEWEPLHDEGIEDFNASPTEDVLKIFRNNKAAVFMRHGHVE